MKFESPAAVMQQALNLAQRGLGQVEPNPAVGSVIVDDNLNLLGEGYHERFGSAHAEINALKQAGPKAKGAILFVTLEPCCHAGKTGPCAKAVIKAGLKKVVISIQDPAPHVSGGGIKLLKEAGIEVEVGLLQSDVKKLNAPFIKFITQKKPYLIAKWAMTLDGKLAARTGDSQWISNEQSRKIVHDIRGRVDGILVGSGTQLADNPALTARPSGPRTATRIVLDSQARTPLDSQLVQTAKQIPVLLMAANTAPNEKIKQLKEQAVQVWQGTTNEAGKLNWDEVLSELGQRNMTNILVEGGSEIFASLWQDRLIDEAHVFIAPKLVGGKTAFTPLSGLGLPAIPQVADFEHVTVQLLNEEQSSSGDIYIQACTLRGQGS